MGGVEPAHVHGRVGLGVAQALGLRQHVGERAAAAVHFREDVVAGPVEDAGHRLHVVADHGLAQHLDRRRSAHDCGLEQQRHALGLGQGRQLGAVLGDQRLVGGDDRLAGVERGFDRGLRRAVRAADQFDEDVDVRRLRQFDRIVVPGQIRDIERTRPRARARRNAGHHSLAAGRSEAGLIRQEVQQAAADRTQARDADPPLSFTHCAAIVLWARPRISSALARNFFTLRAACRIRCSFSTRPIRT